MIQNIENDEIEFCECLYNPVALAECLFSDLDNLQEFEDDSRWKLRLGQLGMIAYEYMLFDNPRLTKQANFKLREGSSNLWCFGGRKFGKSKLVEMVDILLSFLLNDNDNVGFSSYDFIHIKGILNEVTKAIEYHPILRSFKRTINKSPAYLIDGKNGYHLESINMNITSTEPGKAWFQKHFTRIYIEEASGEIQQAYEARLDAIAEIGCVYRIAGMTNFIKYSPAGKAYFDISLRPWICNLPQFLTPTWNAKEREKAIKKHGGEHSVGYKVFVKGEVTEQGTSVFDMQRVRQECYDTSRTIKHFEVSKETFSDFQYNLIIERLSNASKVFVCADIGEAAPSEILIIFEVNNKFKYEYNITLQNLTDKEQFKVFKYIAEKLNAEILAVDCGDGIGRSIYRSIEECKIRGLNLVWYQGGKKIEIDFDRDEAENIIFKDGHPVYREELMAEFSVLHLKEILYSGSLIIPMDYRFDEQVNSVISMQTGMRTVYECSANEDHLFDAFKVFSIAHWYVHMNLTKTNSTKSFCKSGV